MGTIDVVRGGTTRQEVDIIVAVANGSLPGPVWEAAGTARTRC
ncbi:hypothetical protein [Lentzea sp. HUAS12]|nr:hypothetical protein [Lentzea sp. HUAS12]